MRTHQCTTCIFYINSGKHVFFFSEVQRCSMSSDTENYKNCFAWLAQTNLVFKSSKYSILSSYCSHSTYRFWTSIFIFSYFNLQRFYCKLFQLLCRKAGYILKINNYSKCFHVGLAYIMRTAQHSIACIAIKINPSWPAPEVQVSLFRGRAITPNF